MWHVPTCTPLLVSLALRTPLPDSPVHAATAEYIQKRGRENVTTEEIVRAIRPEGRASVPDSVKAELLAEIKKFIMNI